MILINKKYRIILFSLTFLVFGAIAIYLLFKGRTESGNVLNNAKRLASIPYKLSATKDAHIPIQAAEGCFLKINSGWGTQVIGLQKDIILPKSLTINAGLYHLSLWCGFKNLESKTLEITSLESEGEIDSYIGSKSIPADRGLHWAMLTSLPTDKFRNMVSDFTKVDMKMIRPNGGRVQVKQPTKDGIAYLKILSNSQTGKTIISTSTLKAYGKEKELLELPNFPVGVKLIFEKNILFADNRQYFKVLTDQLIDRFGNRIADGTLVKFRIEDSKGNLSYYRGFSSDGIASLNIQNPDNPGILKIVAYVDNLLSSSVYQLNFQPYITSIEVSQNKQYLEIGPILGPFKQLASDGKEVVVSFKNSKIELIGILRNGRTKVEIPKNIRKGEEVAISIGGIQKKLTIK